MATRKNEKPDDCYTSTMAFLKLRYAPYRKKWDSNGMDDRGLFCRIYDAEMEALEVMKGIHNCIIWCGYNKEFDKDMKVMDNIIERFKDRADIA